MPEPAAILCAECSTSNRARALFCASCGARLARPRRTGAYTPVPPPPGASATRPMGDRRIRGWMASFDFDDNGEGFVIRQGENLVGRDPRACSVLLAGDSAVSREHCVIHGGDEGVTLTDLGSDNGTRVNGERLDARPRPLQDGDHVGVGRYTLIVKLLP